MQYALAAFLIEYSYPRNRRTTRDMAIFYPGIRQPTVSLCVSLTVIPIEAHRLKLQNTFRTPVYTTSMRRNAMGVGLVFEADLHTTEHISHWVLQGVCLTLNSD